MGTPNFACPALEKLIANPNYEIVGVYCREPKISGRGHKIQNTPIHNLALKHDLEVFTPKSLKDEAIQEKFQNLNADAAIVVAYGLLLPQEILEGTKFGCFNIHPSALPKYRGAAPIQRTIMEGEKETAICIIKMDQGLDSGDIINEEKYLLQGDETYNSLEMKFAEIGANLIIKTLEDLKNNNLKQVEQDDALMTYAKKIQKEECKINWQNSAINIERKIRGLNGSLGAYFLYDDEKIKILEAEIIEPDKENKISGQIIDDNFTISCKSGFIKPIIAQRQGKKAMNIKEILLGFSPKIGKIIYKGENIS